MLFVIWSIEHDAWWRPHRWGYTTELSEAGLYSAVESAAIVAQANQVAFHECRIPAVSLGLTMAIRAIAAPELDERIWTILQDWKTTHE